MIHLQPSQLRTEKFFLSHIFSAFLFIILPEIGKLGIYVHRHQSRKNGITAILCSCRQNTVKSFLRQYAEALCKYGLDRFPLIEPQIINQNKKNRYAFFKTRKYFVSQQIMAHDR